MYYILEIWTNDECQTTKALHLRHAQEFAQEAYDEYMAIRTAAGLPTDISIVIHQCIQVIEFKPKGEE
jgi:phosphodiesterase/alkaline phosphatase D-like protein